jgi:hypothetical protein
MSFFKIIARMFFPPSAKHQRHNRKVSVVRNTSPFPEDPHFEAQGPLIDRHYVLHDQIEAAWKSKNRDLIIKLCNAQISIASDVLDLIRESDRLNGQDLREISHTGFERLAMLYEKESDFDAAIQICENGRGIGWGYESLNHRAERCRRKAANLKL